MSKNSMENQKKARNTKVKSRFDGKTNTTKNVLVEQPQSYSKVERAEVQAGVKDPSEIVSKTKQPRRKAQ